MMASTTFLLLITIIIVTHGLAFSEINPSKVLVLYNADWNVDDPLTEKGQDSKEIAEYYVKMHTDPITGEKPYLLGISAKRLKHLRGKSPLNKAHLGGRSTDNKTGVVFFRNGKVLRSKANLRDSRLIEFSLPSPRIKWLFESLELVLINSQGDNVTVVRDGRSEFGNIVKVQEGGKWNIRLNGKFFFDGIITTWAFCKDKSGKRHGWKAKYYDFENVRCSRTGVDCIRDDQEYKDIIEKPLKAFLEDPHNARPDGTLLKDHILFIVLSYGMPKTTVAAYGIARGIGERLNDYGAIVDLGQRIEVMYYDLERIMGFKPRPHKFSIAFPFSAYFLRAPQAWPLFGIHANPFLHPDVYKKKTSFDHLREPLQFTTSNRKKFPYTQPYFVMRIDAPTPLQAKALIDRAVYASTYAGPKMGGITRESVPKMKNVNGSLRFSKVGSWLWGKGFRHIYYGGASRDRLALFLLQPAAGFFNKYPVYLPGGIGGTVISHNGWNRGEMIRDLASGITGTIGVARVYRGAPHIHNKSWWDDEILYPFLLKGKTLGEVFLMNQVHLEWIATFIGDPLYRLPTHAKTDRTPPSFNAKRDVKVVLKNNKKEKAVWLVVNLHSKPDAPETAQMRAISSDGKIALCQTFEARPYVLLGDPKSACNKKWHIKLVDPYKNYFGADLFVLCNH